MPYVVKKRESYRWPVEHVLSITKGRKEVMAFEAEFRALPQKRVDDITRRAIVLDIKDQDAMDELLVEIHELERDGGGKYTKADLNELAELYPGLLATLARAWVESVTGGVAARKN